MRFNVKVKKFNKLHFSFTLSCSLITIALRIIIMCDACVCDENGCACVWHPCFMKYQFRQLFGQVSSCQFMGYTHGVKINSFVHIDICICLCLHMYTRSVYVTKKALNRFVKLNGINLVLSSHCKIFQYSALHIYTNIFILSLSYQSSSFHFECKRVQTHFMPKGFFFFFFSSWCL